MLQCESCNRVMLTDWLFCPHCGKRLSDATEPPKKGEKGGAYGDGVRAQVFEVVVRQAMAGADWRNICAGPMRVNNITPEEVEAEVARRR